MKLKLPGLLYYKEKLSMYDNVISGSPEDKSFLFPFFVTFLQALKKEEYFEDNNSERVNHKKNPKSKQQTCCLYFVYYVLPVGVDCCSDGDAVGGKTRKSSPPSAACINKNTNQQCGTL